MSSPAAHNTIAGLDREMIEHRVRTIFERRAEGDRQGLMDYLDENVVYRVQGNWTLYPFSQTIHGKENFAKLMAAIEIMYENFGSTIHEMLIDGEKVALHRTSRMRNRGTGAVHEVDLCDFLTFSDGLVIEFAEYPDSVAIAKLNGY